MKIITIIFLLLMYALQAQAQEVVPQGLVDSLAQLKSNVERLSAANQALSLKNEQLKIALKDAQISTKELQQENQKLEEEKTKLLKTPAAPSAQMNQLNKMIAALDQQTTDIDQKSKEAMAHIESLHQQDELLNKQISHFSRPDKASSDDLSSQAAEALEQKQKTKLAMLKLISESQNRQLLLQEQLLDHQKTVPGTDVADQEGGHRKAILETKIRQLQVEIDRLNALANGSIRQGWTQEQIHELESHVNNLENNRSELKSLLVKVQQKAQQARLAKNQTDQRSKLVANITQLKQETRSLKIDLAELQQQMVILDKRKAAMEMLLKKM